MIPDKDKIRISNNHNANDSTLKDSHILDRVSFHVKNLGQIKEAIIDLKDLNIFMGHNSTSKTYLTHTIYGFFKFLLNNMYLLFRLSIDFSDNEISPSGYLQSYALKVPYFLPELSINKFLLTFIDRIKDEQLSTLEFIIPVVEIEKYLLQDLNYLAEYYVQNCLMQDLAIDPTLAGVMLNECSLKLLVNGSLFAFNSIVSEEQELSINSYPPKKPNIFFHHSPNAWQTNDKFAHMSYIIKNAHLNIKVTNDVWFIKDKEHLQYDKVAQLLCGIISQIWQGVIDILFLNPFVICADRANIPLFYKEIDAKRNNLIRSLQNNPELPNGGIGQLLQQQTGNYSQAVNDNINFIRSLSAYKRDYIGWVATSNQASNSKNTEESNAYLHKQLDYLQNKFQYIAEYLSQEINRGNYDVDEVMDQIYFVPLHGENQIKIPIHNVSSSIKSLLILDFYVRYVLPIPRFTGNLLIIDEPELSLHPDNQRKIARLLAMLVNEGVKVMCTTHSDFVIHEFNNLIGLSTLSEEEANEILENLTLNELDGNNELDNNKFYRVKLQQEQISCYEMIDKNNGGIVVKKCAIDKYGIEAQYIDDEGSKINHIMRKIQDKFW